MRVLQTPTKKKLKELRTLECPKCEKMLCRFDSKLRDDYHYCEFCGHEFIVGDMAHKNVRY